MKKTLPIIIIFFLISLSGLVYAGCGGRVEPEGDGTTEQVATHTFSPTTGTYYSDQSVTINCATADATIYYTTDESDPKTSGTQYSVPIPVIGYGTAMTIRAYAVKAGILDSVEASAANKLITCSRYSEREMPYSSTCLI